MINIIIGTLFLTFLFLNISIYILFCILLHTKVLFHEGEGIEGDLFIFGTGWIQSKSDMRRSDDEPYKNVTYFSIWMRKGGLYRNNFRTKEKFSFFLLFFLFDFFRNLHIFSRILFILLILGEKVE